MYLGVVGAPNEEHSFDGRVFLKFVSKCEIQQRASRNQRFSIDVLVNEALKSGAWRELVMEDQRVDEVLDTISTNYDLDEFITDRLELVFTTYTRGGTKKSKCYEMNKCLENLGRAQKKMGNKWK